jgi:phage shock protein C
MQVNHRLYRCRHDRRIAGVAAGLAEYFDADPSLVRILWIASVFLGGAGLFLYVAMALIVPLEPEAGTATAGGRTADSAGQTGETGEGAVPSPTDWHAASTAHRHATVGSGRATTYFGIVLILFGGLALLDALLPEWARGAHFLWPAFIVGLGVLLVASAVRRDPSGS